MISRSARKFQEPLLPVSHQETVRKFGNYVNRPEKSSQMGRSQPLEKPKVHGVQNSKQYCYNQNLDLTSYEGEKKYIASQNQPLSSNQSISADIGNDQKKQKQNRNRQFVAKVENINKIHDQINSLLKFVKNGESKLISKQKQIPPQRSKTTDNTLKHKMKDQNFKRPILEEKVQESLITPVTQGDRNVVNFRKSCQLVHHQQKLSSNKDNLVPSKYSNAYMNLSSQNFQERGKLNHKVNVYEYQSKKESPVKISNQLMRRLNQAKDSKNFSPKYTGSTTNKSQIPTKNTTADHKKQTTPTKHTYSYNFDSNEDPVQVLKSRNFTKLKNQKHEKLCIDYDHQIAKVRQRIQSSQQTTKKMQDKYLKPDHRFRNQSYVNIKKIQEQIVGYKPKEQLKSRMPVEKKSYLNVNIDDMQTRQIRSAKNKSFQIKVYSCRSTEKLSKSEICKCIADRLSDQLKLDQKLKDARQLFNDAKIPDKWKSLQQKLKQFGLSFTLTELENQLNISSNQSNPFNDDSSKTRNVVSQLAQTFARSQQYWEKKFCKFLSRATVEASGFKVSQMDLDQRGYLTVEDLVCFINLHSSNFFRNRDMIYLFRRIMALGKNRNGIDYQNFLNIISSD